MTRRLPLLAILPGALLLAASIAPVSVQAGGGCHGGEGAVATEAAGTTVVRIDGCTFAPTVDRVPVGTAVTFLNTSQVPHDVTGTPGRADSWGSPMLQPGGSFLKTFAAPGVYAYSCSLHPGMAGVVVAGEGAPAAMAPEPAAPESPTPQLAASTAATAGNSGDSVLPFVVVGGAGLALGALGSALFVRRRDAVD